MTTKEVMTLIPQYIRHFTCIGSSCEDTCCAGWRVNIDEKTFKKYKKVRDPEFKSQMKENVIRQKKNPTKSNAATMRMNHMKCSFLNKEGLCSIQLKFGEKYLSDTCSIYPRINRSVNKVLEHSLTLSCPEAARLVLLSKEGISFESNKEKVTNRNTIISNVNTRNLDATDWKLYFDEYRYITIYIMQSRSYSLEERLLLIGMLYNDLEDMIANNEIKKIPDILGEYLGIVEGNKLKNSFNNISNRLDIQIKLLRELLLLRLNLGINSKRYLECSQDMLLGLKIEKDVPDEVIKTNYENSITKYYNPFMKRHEYILENYLVNYIFKNCMPVDSNSPFESYTKMILHYSIIKIHLIGIANHHKGLNTEMIIKLIQSISKTFEHNTLYFDEIMNLFKEKQILNLTYMSILIKN